MFLRLVHVTSSKTLSRVIEGRNYLPRVGAGITHVHVHVHRASVAEKKRTKYDVIKRQRYELTGFGNYYVEVVNFRIIN